MWFIIGIGLGAIVLGLLFWIRSKAFKVTWYEYLFGTIGLLLLILSIQNFIGSVQEVESTAAWMMLLFLGLPALILLTIVWQLALRHNRAAR